MNNIMRTVNISGSRARSSLSARRTANNNIIIRKNRFMFTLAIIFTAVVIVFVAGSVIVKAGNSYDVSNDKKCFTSISVESGDTLWSIAKEHIDLNHYSSIYQYMDEIISLNHLQGDQVKAGQSLLVSYYTNEE